MKLIINAADYALTPAISDGILHAIENGALRSVGTFTNMPNSEFDFDRLLKYKDIDISMDLNVVAGPCLANPKKVPTLVNEKGYFYQSVEKYADPRFIPKADNNELWPYEEIMIEGRAQIDRFIELTGRKPDMLNGHSISSVCGSYLRAKDDLSKEYGIPLRDDELYERYHLVGFREVLKDTWCPKPLSFDAQASLSTLEWFKPRLDKLLEYEGVVISTHCGFVDALIFEYSTFTLVRMRDHEFIVSEYLKEWVKKNNVEVTSFGALKKANK